MINNNIKDLIRIFKEFSERTIEVLRKVVQCLSGEGVCSVVNDIEDHTIKFYKFSSEIEDKKVKFLRNINRLNIKDILFKPLNEHFDNDFRRNHTTFARNNNDEYNEHVDHENTHYQMNVSPSNDEGSHMEEPQLISPNVNINTSNNNEDEIESMHSKSYTNNQNPNLRQSQTPLKNSQMNRTIAKTSALKEIRKECISRFFNFVKDQINNNNVHNTSHCSSNSQT